MALGMLLLWRNVCYAFSQFPNTSQQIQSHLPDAFMWLLKRRNNRRNKQETKKKHNTMHWNTFFLTLFALFIVCREKQIKFNISCIIDIGKEKFLVVILKFVVLQWEKAVEIQRLNRWIHKRYTELIDRLTRKICMN